MTRKYLRTISLLLPFMAISTLVHAAPTDRHSEVRSFLASVLATNVGARRGGAANPR
jgi:hypothetical protein